MHRALWIATHDPVIGNVREVDVPGPVPGGPLCERHCAFEFQLALGNGLGKSRGAYSEDEEEDTGEQSHASKLWSCPDDRKQWEEFFPVPNVLQGGCP